MRNTLHTPGPWITSAHPEDEFQVFRAGVPVAKAMDNCDSREQTQANANLIAAAPDLLTALENAVRCGERDGMPGNPGSAPKWVIAARAAIAKAKGGA